MRERLNQVRRDAIENYKDAPSNYPAMASDLSSTNTVLLVAKFCGGNTISENERDMLRVVANAGLQVDLLAPETAVLPGCFKERRRLAACLWSPWVRDEAYASESLDARHVQVLSIGPAAPAAYIQYALQAGYRIRQSYTGLQGGEVIIGTWSSEEKFVLVSRPAAVTLRKDIEREIGRPTERTQIRELIAKDYGVKPEHVFYVDPYGCESLCGRTHIDLRMMAIGPKQILINDSLAAYELQQQWLGELEDQARVSRAYSQEKADINRTRNVIDNMLPLFQHEAKSAQEVAEDLRDKGFDVYLAPIVFEGGIFNGCNFANAVMGRHDDGTPFIMVTGGVPLAEKHFVKVITETIPTGLKPENIHFMSDAWSRESLDTQGGVRCRTTALPRQSKQ